MSAGRPRVPAAVAGLAGAAFGLHRLVDPDLPQQIAVGRAILSGSTPVGVSSFVHPFPAFAYVEDKWLASVVVAAIDGTFGEAGLMAWQIGLCALVALSWFVLLRRSGARSGASLAGTAILLVAGAYRLEPRPDTLSHALLAAGVVAAAGGLPWRTFRWVVPAGIGVWIQFHGYFVNGLVIVAAATVAGLAGDRRGAVGEKGPAVALRRGAFVFVLACVACLAHPQGWRALAWPVEQLRLLAAEPALRSALTEFVPTRELFGGTHAATGAILAAAPLAGLALAIGGGGSRAAWRGAAALAVFVAVAAFPPAAAAAWPYRVAIALAAAAWVEAPSAWREGRRLEVVLLAAFTVLAVPMVRNLSLVPPVAAMLVVPAVQAAWDRLRFPRAAGAMLAGAVVLLAVWARLADHLPPGTYRAPGWTGWGWDASRFPVGAAAFVAGRSLPGPLLNNFDTSGWLLRELHPGRSVFIADNTSMYPASFLREYREAVMAGRVDPEELHARYGVRTAVIDHAAMETPGLVARLARSPAWSLVFLDRAAAVWVRDPGGSAVPVNLDAAIGSLAAATGPSRGALAGSARRLFPEMNLAIFLRAAGRPDLAQHEADRMWEVGPAPEIATLAAAAAEEAGRLHEQVDRLEEAYGRFGGDAALVRWLARARFVRGVKRADEARLAEAIADLERSWELAPGTPGTALALASVEAEAGREEAALDHLRRALRPGGDPAIRRAAEGDPRLAPLIRRLEGR